MTPPLPVLPRRLWRRALPWVALVALLLVAVTLLFLLTLRGEHAQRQEAAETVAAEVAVEVRRSLQGTMQAIQGLALNTRGSWVGAAPALFSSQGGLWRLERRDAQQRVLEVLDSPHSRPLFEQMTRADLASGVELVCSLAQQTSAPAFSASYFVPLAQGRGVEVLDLCVPLRGTGQEGFAVATIGLTRLLELAAQTPGGRGHELSFIEAEGTRLARAGAARGQGVFVGIRAVDLPGVALQLRADGLRGRPSLIPSLNLALVAGLSLSLLALVAVLAHDVRRRTRAEQALAESLAFRKAMEDSLSTGLRARDLDGAVRYVNPAFVAMVGFSADELRQDPPPYWPPEQREAYAMRQHERLRSSASGAADARDGGFDTVFMRKNGERFPVMIYETPLLDIQGRHTGWMSAVVDISSQRRMEEVSRQQQDRLQATARLATVGEMASLLSHELNQPLAAIASYASGSLNLLACDDAVESADDADLRPLLAQALTRIAEQAERAGRVIRSVHDFVRRRQHQRERITVAALIESVMPLVRLQARKSGTQVEVDLPSQPVSVECDRTMVEQVLLNLTRNAIQAMETDTPLPQRVLTLRVRQTHERWVMFSVIDAGGGIAPEAAARLFTPFFTTRAEGMGLGLSLCRTVIEQHGGALDFRSPLESGRGCEFRFTLATPARTPPP